MKTLSDMQARSQNIPPMHPLQEAGGGVLPKNENKWKRESIQQGIQYKGEAKGIPRNTLRGDPRMIVVNTENHQAWLK